LAAKAVHGPRLLAPMTEQPLMRQRIMAGHYGKELPTKEAESEIFLAPSRARACKGGISPSLRP